MKARTKSGSSTMPTPARGNRNGNGIDQRKPWPSEMLKFQSRRKIHFKVETNGLEQAQIVSIMKLYGDF